MVVNVEVCELEIIVAGGAVAISPVFVPGLNEGCHLPRWPPKYHKILASLIPAPLDMAIQIYRERNLLFKLEYNKERFPGRITHVFLKSPVTCGRFITAAKKQVPEPS
ncbi:hypothetical protein Y1Q_0003477 [Alligator mississippiensis]|uniref:Uncharacterized protein n=1 Tax=Alligator mississippiensis TaxID=8496 RepID=A0A151M4A5_ALLMI|nr:hypothetical protein Y1Q_0003477 [Alligator mississippiensis]